MIKQPQLRIEELMGPNVDQYVKKDRDMQETLFGKHWLSTGEKSAF